MCGRCGCDDLEHDHDDGDRDPAHAHAHDHDHDHHHVHEHEHEHEHLRTTVDIQVDVLAKNAHLADHNRAWLRRRGVLALNFVSAPGAGKTTLLERTLRDIGRERPACVIEGDQATSLDADRIRATGAAAVQINTGVGCHLDARAVGRALTELEPPRGSVVFIENVGNLVCPALFDLGERAKVVMLSVTEGDDKPLKYPHMFKASALLVVTKIDLAPYVTFDLTRCAAAAREVNPSMQVLPVSATRGDGLDAFYGWLRAQSV